MLKVIEFYPGQDYGFGAIIVVEDTDGGIERQAFEIMVREAPPAGEWQPIIDIVLGHLERMFVSERTG